MEINKKKAMDLWDEQYGKTQKTVDFAGREIVKSAYNDRKSKYGWNIDHIIPISRGGKNNHNNLICCSIKTNDEKGDKFPGFKANDRKFNIVKDNEKYKIQENKTKNKKQKISNKKNFLDADYGIEFIENHDFLPEDQEDVYIGFVKVRVELTEYYDNFIPCMYNFLRKLFNTSLIDIKYKNKPYRGIEYFFTVIKYDIPLIEQSQKLLDNAVILNTWSSYYLQDYFNCHIRILCGEVNAGSRVEMDLGNCLDYISSHKYRDIYTIYSNCRCNNSIYHFENTSLRNLYPLAVNDSLKETLDLDVSANSDYIEYNYINPKLKRSLEKCLF